MQIAEMKGSRTALLLTLILAGLPLLSAGLFLVGRQLAFSLAPEFYARNLMRFMGDIRPRDKAYWEENNRKNTLTASEYKELGLDPPGSPTKKPKPLAQGDFSESYEPSSSAGGLSRSSRCPANFVSIGKGYCQQVICKSTEQVVGQKEIWKGPSSPGIEHFGGNYYYEDVKIQTGAENDPRLQKIGYYCSGTHKVMLSNKIVPEQ
jgi:hypothetical protein